MSREVDTSDIGALDKEDLLYLRERGLLTHEQLVEVGLDKPYAPSAPNVSDQPNTGDVGTADDLPIVGGSAPPASTDVPPYEEWSKEDLKAEAKVRDLPVSGRVEDLVDRLKQYDEENS